MKLPGARWLTPLLSRSVKSLTNPGRPAATPSEPAAIPKLGPLISSTSLARNFPELLSLDERVAMGIRCRDAASIPKVPGAGKVYTEADGRRVQVMHNGVKVIADGYVGAWMTDLIRLAHGHHEPQEEAVFHNIITSLPPGGTILELGGYWAFYSIWFLKSGPGRRALLLEPDPAHIEIGLTNLALNDVEATVFQGFMGPQPGKVLPFKTAGSGIMELPCYDVAAIMDGYGIEVLTILHCDAQGCEYDVLEQAAPLLRAGRIEWVVVSTHHHSISGDPLTHQRCLALLHSLGAVIEAEHDVYESFSGDGLICARFCAAPDSFIAPSLTYNRASTSLFRHPLYDLAARMDLE